MTDYGTTLLTEKLGLFHQPIHLVPSLRARADQAFAVELAPISIGSIAITRAWGVPSDTE
jgi:hypothetical protein